MENTDNSQENIPASEISFREVLSAQEAFDKSFVKIDEVNIDKFITHLNNKIHESVEKGYFAAATDNEYPMTSSECIKLTHHFANLGYDARMFTLQFIDPITKNYFRGLSVAWDTIPVLHFRERLS